MRNNKKKCRHGKQKDLFENWAKKIIPLKHVKVTMQKTLGNKIIQNIKPRQAATEEERIARRFKTTEGRQLNIIKMNEEIKKIKSLKELRGYAIRCINIDIENLKSSEVNRVFSELKLPLTILKGLEELKLKDIWRIRNALNKEVQSNERSEKDSAWEKD